MRTLHVLAQHPHEVSPRVRFPLRIIHGSYHQSLREIPKYPLRNPDFVQNLDGQGEDSQSFDPRRAPCHCHCAHHLETLRFKALLPSMFSQCPRPSARRSAVTPNAVVRATTIDTAVAPSIAVAAAAVHKNSSCYFCYYYDCGYSCNYSSSCGCLKFRGGP